MWRCRLVDGLIRVLPLQAWQDVLIRRHALRCTDCLGTLAAQEEVRSLLVREEDLEEVRDLWPAVRRRLRGEPRVGRGASRPSWTWITAAAGLLLAILAGIWLLQAGGDNTGPDLKRRLHINYVKIEDEPARAYVFHPKDVEMTLVWVEKNGEGE